MEYLLDASQACMYSSSSPMAWEDLQDGQEQLDIQMRISCPTLSLYVRNKLQTPHLGYSVERGHNPKMAWLRGV